jgi:hypothetical protein
MIWSGLGIEEFAEAAVCAGGLDIAGRSFAGGEREKAPLECGPEDFASQGAIDRNILVQMTKQRCREWRCEEFLQCCLRVCSA